MKDNKKRHCIILTICLVIVLLLSTVACDMSGCTCTMCGNKQFLDLTYTFDYAYIELPTGEVIQGKIESWKDFDDGDQLQIKINGKTYLVHSSKCVLIDN